MIIKTKKEELLSYLEDTSNVKGDARLLYLPQTKDELLFSINECRNEKTPFTISAGRTGTTAGCAAYGGALISLENLNKIIGVDEKNQVIKVEAGVSLESLEREANKYNLTLRASPTENLALAGGAISTCASGVRGFGYGSIRNYISEIELILTSGEVFDIKRGEIFSCGRHFDFECKGRKFKFNVPSYAVPNVKSQAGYFVKDNMDLIDIFIGSEGTLGIIAACSLQLQKMPFNIFDALLFFSEEKDALVFVNKIKRLKDGKFLCPVSLEFFDGNSLKLLSQAYSFIPSCAKSAIYFEQEAISEENYNYLIEEWQKLIGKSKAFLDGSIFADTAKLRAKVFEVRHKLPQIINEFLRQHNQIKASCDICVPCGAFSQMYGFYKEKAEESGIDYVNFGHIGECHLHFNFLPKSGEETLRTKQYIIAFYQKAISLGGTISSEHGIGKIKKPYLKIMYSEKEIKEMAALKKYFDPYCLLGLDNIFDKNLLEK